METTGMSVAELDLELAECLPPREVMWCYRSSGDSDGGNSSVVANGNDNGNTYQEGLLNISALNGNLNGNGNDTFVFQV